MRLQHGQQGRLSYCQHRPHVKHIYRTLIQQRLLVEFSCKLPTLYLPKRFDYCVIIGLCDWQLPQQQNSTISEDSAFHGLLNTYSHIILDGKQHAQSQEELKLDPRRKERYQSGRQSLTSQLHGCSHVHISHIYLVQTWQLDLSSSSLVLWCTLVAHIHRGAAQFIKKRLAQGFPSQRQQYNSLIRAAVSRAVDKQSVDSVGGTRRVSIITYREFATVQNQQQENKERLESLETRPQ